MTDRLGIELLTVIGMPPVEHVILAAELGCGHVSMALTPVPWQPDYFDAWSLRDDVTLRRDMKVAMRESGVRISHAEGFAVRPEVEAGDYARDLDILMELDAMAINSVCLEPDRVRALEQFSTLADLAAEREIGFTIEFCPPTEVKSLSDGLAIIHDLERQDVRLVIDAMHFFRSGGTLASLESVDPDLIGYVQLCDVPLTSTDDYVREACFERCIPGKGELPLDGFIEQMPADVLVGLEIPARSEATGQAQLEAFVARAVNAGRQLFAGL